MDTFQAMTAVELVDRAAENGLQPLLRQLRDLENSDPECLTYPRLKPHDDATAVLLSASDTPVEPAPLTRVTE